MRALKTLDAAGRHLNFSRAADELGVTPAAVSYQIKEIEDQLGLSLFTRTNRSIRMTEAGAVLCNASAEALELMRRAVTQARRRIPASGQLTVSVDPDFAAKWLMQRLKSFRNLWPDVDVRFDVSTEVRDFGLDDIDVAIRSGAESYPELCAHRLFDDVVVPVCSPHLLSSETPLREPADLLNHTLVHIEWAPRGVAWPNWQMWMAAAGVGDFDGSRTVALKTSAEMLQAAINGDAIALVDLTSVANDLSQNRLVRLFDLSIRIAPQFAYFLVYPQESASDPGVVAFRDWVLDEAGRMQP
ncbi:glycine-cleavage system transcriptional activator GcvA 3 [Rhizobium sp. N541]|nr:glycine-cleavage system transcriptional activator GcvA 3 [Rhizobium sp. N324]ANM17542.1 glycine-cleavage system transcriptional activator GcvA 3 [Rhizobium sp. N541]ANM23927.1 glycine-cleavage system transcriptional activator GcvA 3 [Rhizobium sp. N941]OYD04602.1 glycine-cleavage system transcriptional activator GcvA 3 [Rhizobium sp. N4311]